MRTALVILSMVAALAAEAPYHLPRPAPHAQPFHYPPAPAPPLQVHQAPAPQFLQQQQFAPNLGYNYQSPIPGPQYIQHAPHPPPPPHTHHHHHHHHPAPGYIAPAPQPLPIAPQPLPIALHPLPIAPQPLPLAPQPLPLTPQPLPLIQHHPQPILHHPGQSYGAPQLGAPRAPPPPPAPLPVFNPHPPPQLHPQPQPIQPLVYHQHQQLQQYSQQGYNYQQPQLIAPHEHHIQLPLAQTAPVLSSYQADSHQYNSAQEQTHREALDPLVVHRVQNIIKDEEHNVARNAGYQSLVSGVSLEHAKPSVEITSFIHTSPVDTSFSSTSELSESSGSLASVSSLPSAPSTDYGAPSAPAPEQLVGSAISSNFLPQNKPAISYGPPN